MRTLLPLLLLAACDDVSDVEPEPNPDEVITTVVVTFDGPNGLIEARFADPENDGEPIITGATLVADTEYAVSVQFLNELTSPAEDITAEIADESDQHQVFYVTGLSVDYNDQDDNGLPIGLDVTITTGAAGTTDLNVVLRHLPPVDGQRVKVAGLAEQAADAVSNLPGESDADVTLPLTVQ